MELKVCKKCRRLFKYIYGPELCQDCTKLAHDEMKQNGTESESGLKPVVKSIFKEEEERFNQVKDYIISHPKASIVQISEENNITPIELFEWIRDDRLEFSEDSQYAWFECAKCGAKIKSGRVCNNCKIR